MVLLSTGKCFQAQAGHNSKKTFCTQHKCTYHAANCIHGSIVADVSLWNSLHVAASVGNAIVNASTQIRCVHKT